MRVTVVVLSYNRPRMLREALGSVKKADQVVVLDDGSDFDVDALVKSVALDCPDVQVRRASPVGLHERTSVPRLGRLINDAVSSASGDAVTYLCDDDIFHPEWIQIIKDGFDRFPAAHWLKGEWGVFEDGETPTTPVGARPCPLAYHRLTTGNFAHMKICATGCGVRWCETTILNHDDVLIHRILPPVHPYTSIPLVGQAGWRREHKFNLLKCSIAGVPGFTQNAKDMLSKNRFLE